MLSETKPKRVVFSIEFLAKSSHDEKNERETTNTRSSPDAVIHSANSLEFADSAFLTPEKFSTATTTVPTPKYPLKLPLISPTNSSGKRKREDSCDSGVESPSPDRFRHISEASNSSNSSYTSGTTKSNLKYKYEHNKEHPKIIYERKSNFNFNRYLYSYLFSFLQILTKMTSCRRGRKPAQPSHRNKSRSWKNDTSLKSTSLLTSARRWPRHWDSPTNR